MCSKGSDVTHLASYKTTYGTRTSHPQAHSGCSQHFLHNGMSFGNASSSAARRSARRVALMLSCDWWKWPTAFSQPYVFARTGRSA